MADQIGGSEVFLDGSGRPTDDGGHQWEQVLGSSTLQLLAGLRDRYAVAEGLTEPPAPAPGQAPNASGATSDTGEDVQPYFWDLRGGV